MLLQICSCLPILAWRKTVLSLLNSKIFNEFLEFDRINLKIFYQSFTNRAVILQKSEKKLSNWKNFIRHDYLLWLCNKNIAAILNYLQPFIAFDGVNLKNSHQSFTNREVILQKSENKFSNLKNFMQHDYVL